MIAATSTVLLGTLASVVTAQTVDIFLPEYGRYSDSLVAQSVGEVWKFSNFLKCAHRAASVSANHPVETSECRCNILSH